MAAYSKLARRTVSSTPSLPSSHVGSSASAPSAVAASASSCPPPPPPTKVLESFSEEFEIGSRLDEEARSDRQWSRRHGDRGDQGALHRHICQRRWSSRFPPALSVEYQEKQYTQGVTPTTLMRREGAPKERELICGRLIDRLIRPLFPAGFYHEVQVMTSVLSSDGNQDPDIMAANASSYAVRYSMGWTHRHNTCWENRWPICH